jgi:hypothetical protein
MKAKKKEMSMYMGGGKTKPMYMYGGKVYKDGGSLIAALLKDPKQRAAAKKMLGSMEKGGVMNATGETRKKRPLEGASFEEKRAAYRADIAKAAKKELSTPTKSMTAYSLVMSGLPMAKSKEKGEKNINIAKNTAEKGVEGLMKYFKSDLFKGKRIPPREKVEKFVAKYGK